MPGAPSRPTPLGSAQAPLLAFRPLTVMSCAHCDELPSRPLPAVDVPVLSSQRRTDRHVAQALSPESISKPASMSKQTISTEEHGSIKTGRAACGRGGYEGGQAAMRTQLKARARLFTGSWFAFPCRRRGPPHPPWQRRAEQKGPVCPLGRSWTATVQLPRSPFHVTVRVEATSHLCLSPWVPEYNEQIVPVTHIAEARNQL